jgi:hypothetical protein
VPRREWCWLVAATCLGSVCVADWLVAEHAQRRDIAQPQDFTRRHRCVFVYGLVGVEGGGYRSS